MVEVKIPKNWLSNADCLSEDCKHEHQNLFPTLHLYKFSEDLCSVNEEQGKCFHIEVKNDREQMSGPLKYHNDSRLLLESEMAGSKYFALLTIAKKHS